MTAQKKILLFLAFYSFLLPVAFGQEQEKEKKDSTRNIVDAVKDSKVSQELLKTVTRKSRNEEGFNVKSEEAFLPYEGKVVRKIIVNHIGFDKSITDTTRNIKNTIVKVANALHNDSKEWVIREHIFFRENRLVNAYTLADNERFLRDLDFIVDARIFVVPLTSTEDSVDVLVLTRDVFSVGGRVSPRGTDRLSFRLYDVNVLGMGQRVQMNGNYDHDRSPNFGYEAYYRKSSVAGSLINLTAGYTQLNTGSSYGDEDEKAYYLRLDRPLVSPYSRMAGGFEISKNWSQNYYATDTSVFRDYKYNVADVWLGYNIGIKKSRDSRARKFVSARFFQQDFVRQPDRSYDLLNPAYNSRTSFLGSFTLFKQDFYKTQYVYGFGRTEDVPYGHTMSLLFGQQRLLGLNRPYIGFDADKSFVHRRGNFYTLAFRVGAFPYKSSIEDATILLSGNMFSKLKHYRKFMLRRTVGLDLAFVFRQRTNTLLDVNGTYGLEGFRADSVLGTKRLHGRYEMLLFTPWKVFGFKIAPMLFTDVAIIAPKGKIIFYNKPFVGLGGGVRTRNENLVFGTIELKFIYYPRTVEEISTFKLSVSTNLRIKYSGSFVRAPSFIVYN